MSESFPAPRSARGRIDWLDVARGISILLVVAHHSHQHLRGLDLSSVGFGKLDWVLGLARIPLFFAISGFLAQGLMRRAWPEILRRRVALLVWVLVLWSVLGWVFYGHVQENLRQPERGDSLWQLLAIPVHPPGEIWFIWALAVYTLVARAAVTLEMRLPVFAAALALSVATYGDLVGGEFHLTAGLRHAPFFLGAVFWGRAAIDGLTARPWRCLGLSVLAAFGLLLVLQQLGGGRIRYDYVGGNGIAFGSVRFLVSLAGLAAAGAAAVLVARLAPLRPALGYLGRNTLPIYLAHVIVITALAPAVIWLAAELPLARHWPVPAVTAAAVALSLGLQALAGRLGAGWLYAPPERPLRRALA